MEIFAKDQGLLRRFRQGERAALAEVYWAYVDMVEATLRQRLWATPASSAAVAASDLEDLVQEVFIKAFSAEARLNYDGLRPYGSYLFIIARNTLVDWWRRRGREVPIEPSLEVAAQGTVEETSAYADARTMAVVERFVRELPEELRALHEARFDQGLSQREAAVALRLGRQTVRTLERRLTDRLRETLEASEAEAAAPAEPPRRWWRGRG
jgi:RNA polymerase sigma-70 factor (ECF subfamily)